MIKAVLADDEPLIVNGLKKLINWKNLGIKIVGTASNGLDALDAVRNLKPDLLISDIHMPNMTGIELLKIMNSENHSTKVIFISGFHEFSYAHAAIKLGALDYLLKPINKEQLESSIVKALQINVPYSDYTKKEEEIDFSSLDVPDRGLGVYTVLNCQINSKEFNKTVKSEREIISFSTLNLIRDYISNSEDYWVMNRGHNIFITLFNSDENCLKQNVEELTDKIFNIIKEKLGQELIISQGKTVENYSFLKDCYSSSIEVMNNRFFNSEASFIQYRNSKIKRYSVDDLYTIQGQIIESIHKLNRKMLDEKSESYFRILKDVTYANKEATISYCLGAIVSIKKSLESLDIKLPVLDFDDQKFLTDIHDLSNFSELTMWVKSFITTIYNEFLETRDNQIHPEINKIKKYISEHYVENIKLQDLADIVYLHPNYISGYFKKITGHTFKDYLTGIRMVEAEKLFLTSDLKVYEIAEKVGFTDYRHFSLVFKKRFGICPRYFRNK